jgi:hypothetical protein
MLVVLNLKKVIPYPCYTGNGFSWPAEQNMRNYVIKSLGENNKRDKKEGR